MKNIILFWPRFFKEAYITYKFRKAAFSIEKRLNEAGMRVDWLGRIYTVVNIKEEFHNQPDLVQQSMVFQELSKANEILMTTGLSDLSYPEISKIENTQSYLVVLYPDNDHFTLFGFIMNTIFLALLIGAANLFNTHILPLLGN